MTPRANPRQRLQQVAELVRDYGPAELADWFGEGVNEFEGGAKRSLDMALGLRGRGIELPPRTLARAARDAALVRVWLLFPDRPDETIATRGRRFAAWLTDFGLRRWPRIQSGARAPADALEAEACAAFEAAEPLVKVPASWDRLRAIVLGE
ncbi:hypothetical protein ThidrDRAFT_4568 [Thiorhodococcus drewsii AZ1]|uniref:Uncharacterized protein n=2 Tax=Thiorhodococcus drewsii TaxID=210408 RepID=G2E8F4_9GAMM|nr:hypothetical protein ThidrDRAFT_4568 [Thiorhodococcus drewsii AZ1]